MRGLGVVSYRLSPLARERWGHAIGTALRLLSASRARVTLDNIAQAFPEQPHEWHLAVQCSSYHNLGITLLELLMFPHLLPSETRELVEFRNLHLIEDEYQHKQGLVLVSGHYGNWELMAFALPLFVNLPISVIVTHQSNSYADRYLQWYRSRTGNHLIPMDKAARQVIERLRAGEAVAMLADQAATPEKDVFVPFFGRLACTYEAPAALALRYNASMLIGCTERMDDGRYVVDIQRIPHEDLAPTKDGIRELTCRHVAALEAIIRKRPELWAWQHKRWKHSPVELMDT